MLSFFDYSGWLDCMWTGFSDVLLCRSDLMRLVRHERRQQVGNQKGFVRAISDMPDRLVRGQGQLEKVMQRCFVSDLEIWPRASGLPGQALLLQGFS